MNISEFVNGYKLAKDKTKYVMSRITTKYLPYEMKQTQAKLITDYSMYKTVNDKKIFWMNTPLQYQLFTQTVVKMYTDIDLTDGADDNGAILRGFNMLEESGAMSDIIQAIGSDFNVFQTVLKMNVDDAIANNSLMNWIDTKAEAFTMVLGTLQDAITELQNKVGTET